MSRGAAAFHPAVATWFSRTLGEPTDPQSRGWPEIRAGRDVLIAAPTGSGKTLAAFLCAIDALATEGATAGALPNETRVLYLSPLRALTNDIEKNLVGPLAGIRAELDVRGIPAFEVRTSVRTGDTAAKDRARTTKKPPHIFATTPESLYVMLTSEGGRAMLRTVRTVIVDEIHALVPDKRGSHLALSLERLDALVTANGGPRPQRIGLSATQRPIEEVARFLVGARRVANDDPNCAIIDTGHTRTRDLAIEIPGSPLETVMSGEVWEEVFDRISALVREHKTTLVFVNTRRLCERLAKNLSDRLGKDRVTAHHGALAREHRLAAEQKLKGGELSALVATASLELGIDIGDVDLVVQVGATRSIASFLQRVGRSGHHLRGTPKGRLFPLSRDELVEATALLDAVRRGELDRASIPDAPLDILAQQIIAATAGEEEWTEDALYELVRGAWPYRALSRKRFDDVIEMVAGGFATARGRRGAHLHRDQVAKKVRPRRGARIAAMTSGGAIPDVADYEVLLEPSGTKVGTLNEDFAIESNQGDIFQLGNTSYVIKRVEPGRVRVEDARGAPPTVPFWLGEAPARTAELSHAVSRLREEIGDQLDATGIDDTVEVVAKRIGVGEPVARQVVEYVDAIRRTLGALPSEDRLVIERFFDEQGGMHLVLHAPLGARINRAWGLALRKSFCRKFDFELQAAANEDALVLSLGPTHSFAVDDVWHYLRTQTARDVLTQALLDAPMFATRWRWNTQRALAVLRFRGGKKVPPRFARMDADDLLTVCFPDQVACAENLTGEREIPDHPLVAQTIHDCMTEAMDADGLLRILDRIERASIELVARDLTEPSPLAAHILTARPYAFLDDAPLEERRTQAVLARRWLDPKDARDLGALDAAAIARVCEDAWPDPRDTDELVDALGLLGFATEEEGARSKWERLFDDACAQRRATAVFLPSGARVWVAADRLAEVCAVHADARAEPPLSVAPSDLDAEKALFALTRARLESIGPTTAAEIAATFGVREASVSIALAALESEGLVFRGSFRKDRAGEVEWCERRLLARIHRATLERLRAEIEPVSTQDFMRYLLKSHGVTPPDRGQGANATERALSMLEGFEIPAGAWETDVLPARISGYEPSHLDQLSLAGRVSWLRRTPSESGATPIRTTPVAIVPREAVGIWRSTSDVADDTAVTAPAERVAAAFDGRGAMFFDDVVKRSGLVRAQVEEAIGELVARGVVTSDGFAGVRALIGRGKRASKSSPRHRGRATLYTLEAAGRWSLMDAPATNPAKPNEPRAYSDDTVEHIARVLLRRWGVVFRRLLDREDRLPPWRDLARVYRRMEARGEIRGGRFVAGPTGEQFALPDAVGALRAARRAPKTGELVALSACDPLNLVGILLPGKRIGAHARSRILFRDGEPIASREAGALHLLANDVALPTWTIETELTKRSIAPSVRAYVGNAG